MSRTVIAGLVSLFSILLTYFTYNLVSTVISNIDATASPVAYYLTWSSYIIFTLIIILVGPLLIVYETNVTPQSIFIGYTWVIGSIIVMTFTVPLVVELSGTVYTMLMNDMTVEESTFVLEMGWFVVIIMYVVVLYLVPLLLTFQPELITGARNA